MMEAWATTSKSVCVWECIQTITLMEFLVGSRLSKEEEMKSEKGIGGEGRGGKGKERSQRERKKEEAREFLYCLIKVILRIKIR